MTSSIKFIFNKFRSHIVSITENREEFEKYIECWDEEKRHNLFRRKRVWTFARTVQAILSCFKESLSVEVEAFLLRQNLRITTSEAYIKRRAFISSELFRDLSTSLLRLASRNGIMKGWLNGMYLCGIDGTRLSLPYTPALYKKYRQRSDRGHNLARGVFITDLINRTVVAADILPNKTEERKAALSLMEKHEFPYGLKSTIFVMDRGYPSLQLMNWFHRHTGGFIIRARRDTNPAISRFMDSTDTTTEVTLSLSSNRRDIPYARPTPLKVRLIKRQDPSKAFEPVVIITDLDRKQFTDACILQAYRLRWNSETEIGTAKNELQIEVFSGIREICIRQDFFANILLYNIESLIRIPCNETLANHKNRYRVQVDMNCSWEPVCGLVAAIFQPQRAFDNELTFIVKIFLRIHSIIRPGRHGPRIKKRIKLDGKYITLTNYKRGL